MKNIIFVCHYFPPQQNVGVRRVLFWANYFSDLNYKVTIVTTRKIETGSIENVLSRKVEVLEFGGLSDSKREIDRRDETSNENLHFKNDKSVIIKLASILRKFKQRYVNGIFGQLMDNRLPTCIMFCLRFYFGIGTIYKHIFRFEADDTIVISTAPPWPVHLVGMIIASKMGFKRIVDYRDPFSGNHIFTSKFRNVEKMLDVSICRNANLVTTVSPSWVDYYSRFNTRARLLRNGFDSKYVEFDLLPQKERGIKKGSMIDPIKISYFGSIEIDARVPCSLLDSLKEKPNIEVHFYGNCYCVKKYLENTFGYVPNNVVLHGFVDYNKSIEYMKGSDINLVAESFGNTPSHRGLVPTKLYEYLSVLKPIIVIAGENSDMHDVCKGSGLLYCSVTSSDFDYNRIFDDEFISKYRYRPNVEEIYKFTRQNVANELEQIMKVI